MRFFYERGRKENEMQRPEEIKQLAENHKKAEEVRKSVTEIAAVEEKKKKMKMKFLLTFRSCNFHKSKITTIIISGFS